MLIKVWGSRGSVPVSGKGFENIGGNTTCLEVRLDNGKSILIDAGTGICAYDRETEEKTDVLLLTHCHLDHIQGLPFYSGMYGQRPLRIIGQGENAADLEAKLALLFNGILMPVMWKSLSAPKVEAAKDEAIEIHGARASWCPTNHPGGCIAWKIEADGMKFAFTGDHEIPLGDGGKGWELNAALMDFLSDCDIVLADGYFTDEEHAAHAGWGHSTPSEWRGELAARPGWKGKVLFTHFNPACDDLSGHGVSDGEAVKDNAVITRDGMLEER